MALIVGVLSRARRSSALDERRVQVAQRADALDRLLGRERLARYTSLRRAPYTVGAEVAVPPRSDRAGLKLHIALDPIPIEARVGCSPRDPGGIREATVNVSTPISAVVHLGAVEQSPNACGSQALAPSRRHSLLEFTRLVIGAGQSIGADRRWRWAVFVGSSFALFG